MRRQGPTHVIRLSRPLTLLLGVAAVLLGLISAPVADLGVASASGSETATYLYNNGHDSFDASEATITPATASSLAPQWTISRYWSTNQPIVAGGEVYWSDWNGILHATNTLRHDDDWTANLGTTTSACGGVTGPDSSATVATVGGVSTVFIGGGTAQVEAFNASTGQVIWNTQLSTDPAAMIWSSPTLFDGSIFIGLASAGSCPNIRGALFKLNATNGAIEATFYSVPQGCIGGGIWSSPTIDEATGILYVGTGNANLCPSDSTAPAPDTEPDAQAIVALRTSDLSLVGAYQPPNNAGDNDFGATPTLFSATIAGQQVNMVGAINKNATYYALNRSDISAGPVWTHFIGTPGACEACTATFASNSSFDGNTLYLAGDVGVINGQSCPGTLSAIDPATGNAMWTDCLEQGRVLGAVNGAPGIVEVGAGDHVLVANDATGQIEYDYAEPSGNYFWSPGYFADGVLYVSNNDGTLLAFAPTPGAATPESPQAVVLPIIAVAGIGAAVWRRRRGGLVVRSSTA